MSNLVFHRPDVQAIALPEPRVPGGGEIRVRVAVESDLAFVDQLQKMHTKAVGWMPRQQLENYIQRGQVLIAEQRAGMKAERHEGIRESSEQEHSMPSCLNASMPAPLGYCISQDKYLKREELGIVYQLNVLPMKQRGLIGATLIKHVFDRAAYGCKLFCCWCAQDLEANYFWESIGFVPLAFRTGSRPRIKKDGTVSKRERTHIFWQRRIREGDTETPYWFPSETSGGAVREARLVLPIPPGTHWSDAKPAVLPEFNAKLLESVERASVPADARAGQGRAAPPQRKKNAKPALPPAAARGGLWFAPPKPPEPPPPTPEEIAKAKEEKKKARQKFRNDPKLVAAARELRDRYTEQINAAGNGLLLPPSAYGKYDVSRALEGARSAMRVRAASAARLLDVA